ncbi:MAG TPA: outer membrane protein assembly factor BamD [Candidatus Bathyarchaeia archaeon]|nr:outer membrane protein assembly factor BamD [Candidatus Bathyarchaeia archaeon]
MNTRLYVFIIPIFNIVPAYAAESMSNRGAHHARARKSSGTKIKRKTMSDMTYEEMKVVKNKRIAENNWEAALAYLERMLKNCNNVAEMAEILLDMADVLFSMTSYDKASKIYQEFVHLYPGHEKREYALYRAIVCSSNCILSAERDQTKTEETIKLANEFLEHSALFVTYRDAVEAVRTQCYQTLALQDIHVCLFYLKRGSVDAARKRFDYITKTWQPYLSAFAEDVAYIAKMLTLDNSLEQVAHIETSNEQKLNMSDRF